jgi:Putative adhesin
MSRLLFVSALLAVTLIRPTVAATIALPPQDWCKDAGSYNNRDENFCEVRELKESGQRALDAEVGNGSVTVTGSSRTDVMVRARVIASAPSTAEARDLASQVTIRLENGRLRASGPVNPGRKSWSVSYRVQVPTRYDLTLNAANGSLTVTDVHGTIDAETANGSIRLTDLGGRVRARTTNGSTHVQVTGTKWDGEGLSVITSNGSARLDLPQNFNAELAVSTNNGGIDIDFPVQVQGRLGRSVETTLGTGGPRLDMRTSNGSVRVTRR